MPRKVRPACWNRKYDRLDELVNANFDLRAQIYQIDQGNLEMVHAAPGGPALLRTSLGREELSWEPTTGEEMFQRLTEYMRPLGVMVIKPKIVADEKLGATVLACLPGACPLLPAHVLLVQPGLLVGQAILLCL